MQENRKENHPNQEKSDTLRFSPNNSIGEKSKGNRGSGKVTVQGKIPEEPDSSSCNHYHVSLHSADSSDQNLVLKEKKNHSGSDSSHMKEGESSLSSSKEETASSGKSALEVSGSNETNRSGSSNNNDNNNGNSASSSPSNQSPSIDQNATLKSNGSDKADAKGDGNNMKPKENTSNQSIPNSHKLSGDAEDEEFERLQRKYKQNNGTFNAREIEQLLNKPFIIEKTKARLRQEKEEEKEKKRKEKELEKKRKNAFKPKMTRDPSNSNSLL